MVSDYIEDPHETSNPAAGNVELQDVHYTEELFPNNYEKSEVRCQELDEWWWKMRYYTRKYIVGSPIFETFILAAILSNCVFLALDTPQVEENNPHLTNVIFQAELVYFVIFLLEMVLKMIAFGFHRPNREVDAVQYIPDPTDKFVGYFNDGWNIPDFIIVCTSFTIFLGTNISSIRVLRVLKPLRTISRVKGLKVLIETLLQSVPKLLDVCILLMFLFLVFGIIAIQMFMGSLKRRCINNNYYVNATATTGFSWSVYSDDSDLYGAEDSLETFCKKDGSSSGCQHLDFYDETLERMYSYRCYEEAKGPGSDMLNFDNIFNSFFTQFVLVTLEGWADVMYMYQDSKSPYAWFYFASLTFICSFFALNLTLAVLVTTFAEVEEKEIAAEAGTEDAEEGDAATGDMIESDSDSTEDDDFQKQAKETKRREQTELIKVTDAFRVETTREKKVDDSKMYIILAKKAISLVQAERSLRLTEGNPFRIFCNRLSLSENFNWFVLLVILLNTVTLAIQWPGISSDITDKLEAINMALTVFFIVEMVTKIYGLGFVGYASDSFNIFDGVIVLISIVELILNSQDGLNSLRALRMFRVLRVLRVLGKIDGLRVLMGALTNATSDVAYLLIIPFIFIFMFGTLGINLFATAWENLDEGEEAPRETYDNIFNAMLTVFRIITGDDWNEVMFTYIERFESWKWGVGAFYIAIIIFGAFIFLNLFIAVLLSRMSDEHHSNQQLTEEDLKNPEVVCAMNKWLLEDMTQYCAENLTLVNDGEDAEAVKLLIDYCQHVRTVVSRNKKIKSWMNHRDEKRRSGNALLFLEIDNWFRIQVWKLVHSPYFQWSIDTLIIVNCMLLAVETPPTPNDPDPDVNIAFVICDFFFTAVFVMEMFLKIIADGCFSTPILPERTWDWVHHYERDTIFRKLDPSLTEEEVAEYHEDKERRQNLGEKWKRRCVLNLMELQVYFPNIYIGDGEDGKVVYLRESTDGWVVVHYEATRFAQEFRLLFRGGDSDNEYAETIYRLREDGDEGSNAAQGEWVAVEDKPKLEEIDITLLNIIMSPDLTNKHLNAYLADGWNQIDAFVVMISVLSLIFSEYQGLRAMRAVRPLRLAIRFDEIRTVLSALIGALPGVFYTIVFCLLFWMVLAILGTQLFSGKFGTCSWEAANNKDECTEAGAFDAWDYGNGDDQVICRCLQFADPSDCQEDSYGGEYTCRAIDSESGYFVDVEWIVPYFNFDQVFEAIKSIYVIATMDEWHKIMYYGMDSREEFESRETNANPFMALYFVIVVIVGGFFSFNLIVSVVVDNFNRIKEEKDGSIFITESQQRWRESQKLLDRVKLQKRYPQPENKWRKYCFLIAMNPYFDPFIISCICLNAITMAMVHYDMSETWQQFLDSSDTTFLTIFTLEAFLKIMALGFQSYWMENWNRFDFTIVIASLLGKLFNSGAGLSVARVFRIGRVLRLINRLETLRTLFMTLLYSIPSLWNIGLLLFVIFFVYAVIGMNIFGAIEPYALENGITMHRANFQSWPDALSLLYRIGTSDAWGPVYLNCQVQEPDCHGPTCGEPWKAALFFVSFGVIGSLVMINLFIAVILDTFSDHLESQRQESQLKSVFIWSEIWSQVDTNCDKELAVGDFIHTVIRAPRPAGLSSYEDTVRVLKCTRSLSARVMKFKEMREEVSKHSHHGVEDDEIATNNFPSFPTQDEILEYLKRLNLLVYKDKEGEWIVKYKEAVLAIGTNIVGPRLIIHPSEINDSKIPIYQWYCDVFAIDSGETTKT